MKRKFKQDNIIEKIQKGCTLDFNELELNFNGFSDESSD